MKPGIANQAESKSKDIVVYKLVSNKESVCSQCQKELNKGNLLTLEDGKGLCMVCADLDHLVTLPSGDAALTRRTKKYSRLWAVIVRFSRARKRYERQGWLVEEDALTKAEEEVLSESELKEQRRMNEAFRREDEDEKLAREIQTKLLEIFPQCPAKDAERIARQG